MDQTRHPKRNADPSPTSVKHQFFSDACRATKTNEFEPALPGLEGHLVGLKEEEKSRGKGRVYRGLPLKACSGTMFRSSIWRRAAPVHGQPQISGTAAPAAVIVPVLRVAARPWTCMTWVCSTAVIATAPSTTAMRRSCAVAVEKDEAGYCSSSDESCGACGARSARYRGRV